MSWLVTSVVLSIVLTVVLTVGLRVFRGGSRGATSPMTEPRWLAAEETRGTGRRVRVWAPWKAMLLGSLMLTVLVNLVLWIA